MCLISDIHNIFIQLFCQLYITIVIPCYYSSSYFSFILISKQNIKEFHAIGNKVNFNNTAHSTYVIIKLRSGDSPFTRASFYGTANFAIGTEVITEIKEDTNKFLPFCKLEIISFASCHRVRTSVQLQRQLSISF